MHHTLHASPLQGFTDFRFRNCFNAHFGGINHYYSPYIRLLGKREVKRAYERDILPSNNQQISLVPQIMTNSAEEFVFLADYVKALGYSSVDWNLGCPFPMVTKRGLGSAMLSDPTRIEELLKQVRDLSDIKISIKMRLGHEQPDEIVPLLSVLEKFDLEHIAIHARVGVQRYKGQVNLDAFEQALNHTSHRIIYNGDITSVVGFQELKQRFPQIGDWMIGRGLLSDPFLASMINAETTIYPEDWLTVFKMFHNSLFETYTEALSGNAHILLRMLNFWGYFIHLFPASPKGLKAVKKAKNIPAYRAAVNQIFANEQV